MISINCTFGHSEPLGSLEQTFSTSGLYGFTGPNGSGKSTLLDTIAGEIAPLEGEIRISTHDPAADYLEIPMDRLHRRTNRQDVKDQAFPSSHGDFPVSSVFKPPTLEFEAIVFLNAYRTNRSS